MKIDKLNIIAPLGKSDIKGYHITTKIIVKLMIELGMDISLFNLDGFILPEFEDVQKKDFRNRFNLLREIPTVDPLVDGYYTVTEFDQPTWGSISLIRKSKLIITESQFCKGVFEKYTKSEIGIIQTPIGNEFKSEGETPIFTDNIEEFDFKFLSVFEWVMRKDPYTLIKAFVDEFDKDESVCLLLRAHSPKENIAYWIAKLAKDHNVIWLPNKIKDISTLYRGCDCHVSSTLGEGFGRPFVESMACGMLNIIPNSTAMKDYANEDNCLLLDCKEERVGSRINELPHLIGNWFKVQVPDYNQLKSAMRNAFEESHNDLKHNAIKIKDKFTIENTKNQIKEVFEL